jgi:hypothetical protein
MTVHFWQIYFFGQIVYVVGSEAADRPQLSTRMTLAHRKKPPIVFLVYARRRTLGYHHQHKIRSTELAPNGFAGMV